MGEQNTERGDARAAAIFADGYDSAMRAINQEITRLNWKAELQIIYDMTMFALNDPESQWSAASALSAASGRAPTKGE